MANFINTVDALGDNVVADSIINRSIVECKDNIVSFIGDDAFYGCYELTTIDFPAVTNIGNSAFKYCASLVTTILRNDSMVSLAHKSVFDNCYHIKGITNSTYNSTGAKNGYFYVPSVLYDSYIADSVWSTFASQFRKLEEWTVDGTTTGELDLVNRHMVRFFNSDGTLLGYQIVATGEDASYDGTPVCPDNSSAPFVGFKPQPISVTADVDCYAQYISFATATWAEIAALSERGEAANIFAIGDTKTVEMLDGGSITFEIVGFDHDDLADGTGKAGISILAKDVRSSDSHYDSAKAIWPNGTLRTQARGYSEKLPADLVSVIKPVLKKTCIGTPDSHTTSTYTETIWLPSVGEYCISGNNTDGPTYERFKVTLDNVRTCSGSAVKAFVRSTDGFCNGYRYHAIDTKGNEIIYSGGYYTAYITIGFCV